MKALVYHGPSNKAWDETADPVIVDDTDAIVHVDATTICGTDLHILKGDVPTVSDGRVLGHEAVGTVTQIGTAVRRVAVGDRVLVSCITACGTCRYCRDGQSGQCLGGGGWILGNTIDGTQAELVRVPFADLSTHPVPDGVSDDAVLMLADILPTGFEVGVLNGHVQPGDVVVIVDAGPIGLSAIIGAQLYSPATVIAIDLVDSRLEAAKAFGADIAVNNSRQDPLAIVQELTDGLGADVAIEAVGVPATFELTTTLIRPGGHIANIANIGVHGEPVTLHLEDLWTRDITITTGLVDAYSTPTLMRLVSNGDLDPARLVTHHFTLDNIDDAYDAFERAGETGALKIVLTPRNPHRVGHERSGPGAARAKDRVDGPVRPRRTGTGPPTRHRSFLSGPVTFPLMTEGITPTTIETRTAMKIQLNSDSSIECSDALARTVETTVHAALDRYGDRITRVEVHLSAEDANHPDSTRCLLEARPAGLTSVAVTGSADTAERACHDSSRKMQSVLDSTFGRIDSRDANTTIRGNRR